MKAALVLLNEAGSIVRQVILLQYTPELLTHTLQVRSAGGDSQGGRGQPPRYTGWAQQTIKLEAEIDATDRLEHPEFHPPTALFGIVPDLAALEELVNPSVADVVKLKEESERAGILEIVPKEAPLTLFVWGMNRIQPVRVTEFSVTEEAFDGGLNPIRAKVSLGLRVLSTDDLGFGHPGSSLFLNYMRARQALGKVGSAATLAAFAVDQIGPGMERGSG